MPKVCLTFGAANLGAGHPERRVDSILHIFLRDRLPETGPSCARFKLGFGREQCVPAADAPVNSVFVVVPVFACERTFRSGPPRHVILLGRKLVAPFGVCLRNLFNFHNSLSLTRICKLDHLNGLSSPKFICRSRAEATSQRQRSAEPPLQKYSASHTSIVNDSHGRASDQASDRVEPC